MPLNEAFAAIGAASAFDWAQALAKAVGYLGVLYAAGAAFFLLTFRSVDEAVKRAAMRRAAWWAAAGAASTAALIPLRAAFLGGDWATAFEPQLLNLVAGSPLGSSAAVRSAGAGLIICGALLRSVVRPLAMTLAIVGGIAMVVGVTLTGHSASAPTAATLQAALTLHLLAAAFWLGSLFPLHLACDVEPRERAALLMSRFGWVAVGVVFVLFIGGLGLAIALVGSFERMWTTSYGQFLTFKLSIVGALLLLAAGHKLILTPRMRRSASGANTMARSIGIERWIAAAAVVATAILTNFSGPVSDAFQEASDWAAHLVS